MENIKSFTSIAELAESVNISDTLQARLSECCIYTFADLMNTNKREFGRRRMVGRETLKEFVSLQVLLQDTWRNVRDLEENGDVWEQRTWDAALAIMVAYIKTEGDRERIPQWAVERAKDLVAEYRKQQK